MFDMTGHRKVVMVGKDSVTYWDLLDSEQATPLIIHPCTQPVGLGSFVEFCKSKGLQNATLALIAFLRRRIDKRLDGDPLFVMRVLWFVSQKASGAEYTPDDQTLAWAYEQADAQERTAARIHQYAEQFCAA